jgi:cysteine desulfurase
MLPFFTNDFGNPSSASHVVGRVAAEAVDVARSQVAELIGAEPREIVFTAGATESNNLAILGLARGSRTSRRRIVTTAIEHKAVLEPCQHLKKQGFEVIILPVDKAGRVIMEAAAEAIDATTLLVSVQAASNEIGTIQDMPRIADLAHERGALLHTDAAQAVGKILVDVDEWDIDLLSISGHKLYAPKGIGALFIRGGAYELPLEPLAYGGGQEHELRPGTTNVPSAVALGAACAICSDSLLEESRRVGVLRDLFESLLLAELAGLERNGALENRLPGNSSITFPGLEADAIMAHASDLALSTGSACTSGALEPSHVLQAIGLSRPLAYGTIRVGVGRFTTESEIGQAVASLVAAYKAVCALSSGEQ